MISNLILAAALAAWPAPLRDAVTAERLPAKLALTMTIDANEGRTIAMHDIAGAWSVKPAKPGAPSKAEQNALIALKRTKPERDLACVTRAATIPAAVTLKSETAEDAVYSYKPTPAPDTTSQVAAALKYSLAEIRVAKAKPHIIGGRIWTQSPFSPVPLTKVHSYSDTYECGPAPNGVSLVTHSLFELDFSAFGARRQTKRVTQLSDIVAQ